MTPESARELQIISRNSQVESFSLGIRTTLHIARDCDYESYANDVGVTVNSNRMTLIGKKLHRFRGEAMGTFNHSGLDSAAAFHSFFLQLNCNMLLYMILCRCTFLAQREKRWSSSLCFYFHSFLNQLQPVSEDQVC
jgi:hypothetical protein